MKFIKHRQAHSVFFWPFKVVLSFESVRMKFFSKILRIEILVLSFISFGGLFTMLCKVCGMKSVRIFIQMKGIAQYFRGGTVYHSVQLSPESVEEIQRDHSKLACSTTHWY